MTALSHCADRTGRSDVAKIRLQIHFNGFILGRIIRHKRDGITDKQDVGVGSRMLH